LNAFSLNSSEDKEVVSLLRQKRKKFKNYTYLKLTIEIYQELYHLSKKEEKYPDYFNELIENGYIHLNEHLIEMMKCSDDKSRTAKIGELSFSEVSHIILETREALIRKVENSIPDDFDYSKIIFLLGSTGSGKSTTLCFLRGDKMKYRKASQDYISTNDTTLIGEDNVKSCTFIPNVKIVNGFAVVDFAGFEDTNGNLISMGMEFALQALVNKFHPKILVLAPITHKDKYAAAVKLGGRLDRLFGETKKFCMLGITQYSQNPNYKDILTIKESNEKRLVEKEKEIKNAENELANLSEQLKNGAVSNEEKIDIEEQILEKRMEIKILKKQYEKVAKDDESLKNLNDLNEQEEMLQTSETDLMKAIGLKEPLRFDELSDSSRRSDCFKRFSLIQNSNRIYTDSKKKLNAENTELLTKLFERNLFKIINDEKEEISWPKATKLKTKVWESSLIKNILVDNHPEIVELLHLPEIDPSIVHKFDKRIVEDCIKGFIDSCFALVDKMQFDLLMKVLDDTVSDEKLKTELKEKLGEKRTLLQEYVMWSIQNKTEIDTLWVDWQKEQSKRKEAIKKANPLPRWVKHVVHTGSTIAFPLFLTSASVVGCLFVGSVTYRL
jgi:hypothetical protein